VCEILRMTGRARDMVLDPDQTDRLREVITEGAYYGMQTFDQALLHHYKAGRVAMEDALRVASSPHDFKLLVAGDGRTATSMDDLGDTTDGPEQRHDRDERDERDERADRNGGHGHVEAPASSSPIRPGSGAVRPASSLAPPGLAA
jgi:hypothetical protein